MRKDNTTLRDSLVLALLTVFHFVNNLIWLRLDHYPPVDDEAFHLQKCFMYRDVLSGSFSGIGSRLLNVDRLYPPLMPLFSAVTSFLTGRSTTNALIMTNSLFLAGIFICVYLIGRRLGNGRIGLIAAALLSLYPMFFHLGKMFMLETALSFFVVCGVLVLMKTDGFRNTGQSFVFGLVSGLGLLAKQSYAVYVLPMAAAAMFVALNSARREFMPRVRPGRIVLNFLFSAAVCAWLAGLWYFPRWQVMVPLLVRASADSSVVPHQIPIFSFESFLFYPRMLVNEQMLLFFFLVFLYTLRKSVRSLRQKDGWMLYCWIAAPYLLFTLIKNKFWYYTACSLPAFAIFSALGIDAIASPKSKRTALFLIFAFGVCQFFLISYTGPWKKWPFLDPAPVRVFPWHMNDILRGVRYYPQPGEWNVGRIVERVGIEAAGRKKFFLAIDEREGNLLAQKGNPYKDYYAGCNFEGLRYEFLRRNLRFRIIRLANLKDDKSRDTLLFIISVKELEDLSLSKGMKATDFALSAEFRMPDQTSVFLYKRKDNI
jgi:hypothetical protein